VTEPARVWREHERWLDARARLCIERERWTEDDWSTARRAADAAWDARPVGLYLYAIEEACRQQHYHRVAARLAAERSRGTPWLLGVLERTQ
jgi:hypothetical protein